VWTFDKPLVLKGRGGTTIWSDVMFATKSATIRWTGTPADTDGCAFALSLESTALRKALRLSSKTVDATPLTGSRAVAINYGDGKVTVKSDCSTWSVKVLPSGHPGVVVKRTTDLTNTNETTAAGLNDALGESHVDWWVRTQWRYVGTVSPRILSKSVTLDLTFELPSWTQSKTADQQLVSRWRSALAAMKQHEGGEAAVAIQAAGRYLAALTKTKFSSVKAMNRYFDATFERYADWANHRTLAYNNATDWGRTQGAFIE
jgi:hypothetical protein